jgi:hypothetical protein
MHARKTIRDLVASGLSGLPSTGARVYAGRVWPIGKDSDPCLLVYCTEERSSLSAMGILGRELALAVEGIAVGSKVPDVETQLDQIAFEVEERMATDASLLGRVQEVTLTGTRIAVEASGERHLGSIRLEYRVVYRTREDAPGALV